MTLPEILAIIHSEPQRAADELDAIAAKFHDLAEGLRGGNRDGGGVAERLQIQLVGPLGELKQNITTVG